MENEIQITIEKLEEIISAAKRKMATDSDYSSTLIIQPLEIRRCDSHLGSDWVGVMLQSKYSEGTSYLIYNR